MPSTMHSGRIATRKTRRRDIGSPWRLAMRMYHPTVYPRRDTGRPLPRRARRRLYRRCPSTDFFTVERTSSDDEVTVATCLDSEPGEGPQVPGEDATWLNERDAAGYDGPRLVGTIGIGGMGWSVYDENGPAVTQKTRGQGPGGATALYRDSAWRVRRLSPWEALRTRSFPGEVSKWLKHMSEIEDDDRDEIVY